MKSKKFWMAIGSLVFVVGVIFWMQSPKTLELVILHTNDHHGYCWANEKDQGGFAKQMTLIQRARKNNYNVLLLSGGDINSGAPESDFHDAEPSFLGMNLLGFDAMAVGNHEFDKPFEILKKQEEWANFPFLSANIYDKKTGQRLFLPYIIKKVGPLKIGIIGLTTEETAYISMSSEDFEFRDPVIEAKTISEKLKPQVDLLIAVTHMGVSEEIHAYPERGRSDRELARAIPELSVIVGGHSHTLLEKPVQEGNTLILQAGEYAKYMGELHLKVSSDQKTVLSYEYEMHTLDQNILQDPKVVDFLKPYWLESRKQFDQKVGESKVFLDGERMNVRTHETNLGNWVTDIFVKRTKADCAFQNGGGIRASIEKGDITFGDIQKAFPFGNTVVVLELTGSEILEVLDRSASFPRPAGGFLHVSGMTFKIKGNRIQDLKIQGKPVSLAALYRVATNNFLALGNDGFDMLKSKSFNDTGYIISNLLLDEVRKEKVISPTVEGRIQVE